MRYLFWLVTLTLLVAPASAAAQLAVDADPGRSVRTRADLERLLGEYEAALASPAYSASVKRSLAQYAERVRDRLEYGDFRVGDQISVEVVGEPNFPVTVVVDPGPMITLQMFGDIPLNGVLRSEISEHLTAEVSRFIHDPVVRTNTLMRVTVLGGIGSPGFYSTPPETTLGDVLMMAGGPAPNADLDAIRIERAGQSLYGAEEMQEALREGLTLDQLNMRAGDQIFVPAQTNSNVFARLLAVTGAVASTIWLLTRIGVF